MRPVTRVALAGVVALATAAPALAQWGRPAHPSSGVCFYEDINYRGRYFCAPVGDQAGRVPGGSNDEISSIRVFGNAEVTVYRDSNQRGQSRRFTSSIRDLRAVGLNDRITSFEVNRRGYGRGSGNWGGAYGGSGNWGNRSGGNHGYGGTPWGGAYGGGSHQTWDHRDDDEDRRRPRISYREAESMVRRAYQRVFNRPPDPAARPWIMEVIKNGWSQGELESRLRNTPEGRNRRR